MRPALPIILACSVMLSACAEKSEDIQASYVSPIQYQGFSCRQLSEEAARLSAKASQVAGIQDKNAQNDAVATGVSLVLFWPAMFFIGGNKDNAAELSRLKGEMEALEKASIAKNCGISFQPS